MDSRDKFFEAVATLCTCPEGAKLRKLVTERIEEERKAALKDLAGAMPDVGEDKDFERPVSREKELLDLLGMALVGLQHAVDHYNADDQVLSNVRSGIEQLGEDPDKLREKQLRSPSAYEDI